MSSLPNAPHSATHSGVHVGHSAPHRLTVQLIVGCMLGTVEASVWWSEVWNDTDTAFSAELYILLTSSLGPLQSSTNNGLQFSVSSFAAGSCRRLALGNAVASTVCAECVAATARGPASTRQTR